MFTLIHYPFCPFSRKVRIALSEIGIEAEMKSVEPWNLPVEFRTNINPTGEVPVLFDPIGKYICGHYPIVEFLYETTSCSASIIGTESFDRAEVRRLCDLFDRNFYDNITKLIFIEKIYKPLNGNSASNINTQAIRAATTNLKNYLLYIESLLNNRHWLAGENITMADISAGAQISILDYLGHIPWYAKDLTPNFPELKNWYQRLKSRPSFKSILLDKLPIRKPSSTYANLDF
ncbi:MAG: glutathione S-transferase family protein [Alphaproteobacteria bacterium]|nr:glutathione S-transferase family protein [Alphaproteobacteria bacterium]